MALYSTNIASQLWVYSEWTCACHHAPRYWAGGVFACAESSQGREQGSRGPGRVTKYRPEGGAIFRKFKTWTPGENAGVHMCQVRSGQQAVDPHQPCLVASSSLHRSCCHISISYPYNGRHALVCQSLTRPLLLFVAKFLEMSALLCCPQVTEGCHIPIISTE